MAERRMFAKSVVESDLFLGLPASTQLLYFHLGMYADDDGFLSNSRCVMILTGSSAEDMQLLISKGYVLDLGDGINVITHWKQSNFIRSDLYNKTVHKDKQQLITINKNKVYILASGEAPAGPYEEDNKQINKKTENVTDNVTFSVTENVTDNVTENVTDNVTFSVTDCDTDSDNETYAESIRNKVSLDKVNKVNKDNKVNKNKSIPTPKKEYGEFKRVLLSDEKYQELINELGEAETLRCIKYVDELAETTNNKNKWRNWFLVVRRCSREGWGKLPSNTKSKPAAAARDYSKKPEGWRDF